jgi:predicted AlkP superfamily phosphohydrolase/phosphomutase
MTGTTAEGVFVLGLDGVPWEPLTRWVDAGLLPNVERLFTDGAAGALESTVPANTPIAWPSIATGTWPDTHGIYEFMRLDEEYGQQPYTSDDRRQPPLWDIITPAAVGNVPMTYPASEIDGQMVTGMMTPESASGQRFARPSALATAIERRLPEYQVGLDWKEYHGREEEFVSALRSLVDSRRDLLDLMLERDDPELVFFVFTGPDRLQHLVWDEAVLREQYQYFDGIVGDALDYCEANDYALFVVSDHGFGEIDYHVNVNRHLLEQGFFAEEGDAGVRGLFSRAGVSKDRVTDALERVGVTEDLLVDVLPQSVLQAAATRVPGDHSLYDMDPTGTRAFLHGLGSVYVNDTERFASGIVDPSDVPEVKARLIEALRGLEDPTTGRPVLDVHDGADLYSDDEFAPDVVIDGRERYRVTPDLAEEMFKEPTVKVADHRPDGVFLASGPGIEPGSSPEDATVVDVAPTVLHLLGEAVPAGADGRVLSELFEAGSDPAERAVEQRTYDREGGDGDERTRDDEDFSEVEGRLRGLGYME